MNITIPGASLSTLVRSNVKYAAEFLQIPEYSILKEEFQLACRDCTVATRSTFQFLQTSLRPFIILLSLIAKYALILLRIIGEHTIFHAIRACTEALRQVRFAVHFGVTYQKTLSRTAICMEISFVFLLIGLYAIRKYIKRKRYVERCMRWYHGKRSTVVLKYNRVVDRVARTSILLALMLPHILYAIVMILGKWFLPDVLRYFACKTLVTDLIGFYIPFVKTIWMVHTWKSFGFNKDEDSGENSDGANKQATLNNSRRSGIGSTYKDTIEKNNTDIAKKKHGLTRMQLSEEQKQVVKEASELLQYWIVYAFVYSASQTFMLLPILSRILSNANVKSMGDSSLPWKQKKITWLTRIKPSSEFIDEFKLLFFVWLRLLPTSLTRSNLNSREEKTDGIESAPINNVKHTIEKFEKSKPKARQRSKVLFSNRPVDLIYARLSPLLTTMSYSSRQLHEKISTADGSPSVIIQGVTWCSSFLDVMVWRKIITGHTKKRIIVTLNECADLLPALVTLFMPSYFTNYGIIFVSLLVPSGASTITYNSLKGARTNIDTVKIMKSTIRYLQYWVIQGIVSWIVSLFSPVLRWIPLSTHFTFVAWCFVQLEGTTLSLYNMLEWDLVAFGLLHSHPLSENMAGMNVNDSMTMKSFKYLTKRLPLPSSLLSPDSTPSFDDNEHVLKDQSN